MRSIFAVAIVLAGLSAQADIVNCRHVGVDERLTVSTVPALDGTSKMTVEAFNLNTDEVSSSKTVVADSTVEGRYNLVFTAGNLRLELPILGDEVKELVNYETNERISVGPGTFTFTNTNGNQFPMAMQCERIDMW